MSDEELRHLHHRLRRYAHDLVLWGPPNPPTPPVQVTAANFLNDIADEIEGLPRRRPQLFLHDVAQEPGALIERVHRLEEIIARMIDEYRDRWGERAVTWAITTLATLRVDGRDEPHHSTLHREPPMRELQRIMAHLKLDEEGARLAYALGARLAP